MGSASNMQNYPNPVWLRKPKANTSSRHTGHLSRNQARWLMLLLTDKVVTRVLFGRDVEFAMRLGLHEVRRRSEEWVEFHHLLDYLGWWQGSEVVGKGTQETRGWAMEWRVKNIWREKQRCDGVCHGDGQLRVLIYSGLNFQHVEFQLSSHNYTFHSRTVKWDGHKIRADTCLSLCPFFGFGLQPQKFGLQIWTIPSYAFKLQWDVRSPSAIWIMSSETSKEPGIESTRKGGVGQCATKASHIWM